MPPATLTHFLLANRFLGLLDDQYAIIVVHFNTFWAYVPSFGPTGVNGRGAS
jgi:hypothetical protein